MYIRLFVCLFYLLELNDIWAFVLHVLPVNASTLWEVLLIQQLSVILFLWPLFSLPCCGISHLWISTANTVRPSVTPNQLKMLSVTKLQGWRWGRDACVQEVVLNGKVLAWRVCVCEWEREGKVWRGGGEGEMRGIHGKSIVVRVSHICTCMRIIVTRDRGPSWHTHLSKNTSWQNNSPKRTTLRAN